MIDKANQSAALQAATNAYKEAYALDLSDGVLDCMDKADVNLDTTAEFQTKYAGYSVDTTGTTAVAKYTKTDGKWDVKFDGTKWEVGKHNHNTNGAEGKCTCGKN